MPVINIVSDLGVDISKGATARLTASGGASYTWASSSGIIGSQNTATLTVRPAVNTTYTVTTTSTAGCSSVQTIILNVKDDYTLEPNNVITPNGDGKNDYFYIKNLDMYPNNIVKIFDRAGREIYTKKGYQNDFDGTLNGRLLAEGTYYYIIDFGKGYGVIKGFVSIIRKGTN